jgi:pimeloyl-ACP methyl ester carboxylesterase
MRLVDLAFVRRPFLPAVVLRALCADVLEQRPMQLQLWRALTDPGPHAHLLESLLPRLTLPTLVVWGDSDHFFHRSAVETLQRGLPHARFVMMQRCGHLPMFERPAEFASHFIRFVAGSQRNVGGRRAHAQPDGEVGQVHQRHRGGERLT